jgi:hypothetical protein
MNAFALSPTNTVVLHVHHGDVVARGEADAHEGRLLAALIEPGIRADQDATHIHTTGDVSLRLPVGCALQVQGEVGDAVIRHLGVVTIEGCRGDLAGSDLQALTVTDAVDGDVTLRRITGSVRLRRVGGDLAVAAVDAVQIGDVGGDVHLQTLTTLVADRIGGDLTLDRVTQAEIGEVNGDVLLRRVEGTLHLGRVAGDMSMRHVGPDVTATVNGDLEWEGPLKASGRYRLRVDGAALLRLTGAAQIELYGSEAIQLSPDMRVDERRPGYLKAHVGESAEAAELVLEVRGPVVISTDADAGVRATTPTDVREAMAQARRAIRSAADEFRRQALDEAAVLKRQATSERTRSVRSWLRDLVEAIQARPVTPPPPPPPGPPAQDEIRLILEMVAAGTISPEEANRLLEAL